MSLIFLSHSSANNAEAVALYDWLQREGWKDEVFLDLDPARGIAAGERWERALNEAANRCEAVLFLISKAWIGSEWCRRELNLAHRLNKRMFGVVIDDLAITDVPKDLTADWQLVRLASGRDHVMLKVVVPVTQEEVHVTFSKEGLQRLKHGLEQAGLDPKYFSWPPPRDPNRSPYRGLKPLESDDAGIFFGRDGPVIEALDKLRGLRDAAPPRLFVILGASGAGKSSFLRAGLLPRLKRDDRNFLPIPIIRPERGALYGEAGFLHALEAAFQAASIPNKRSDLRAAIEAGAAQVRPLLKTLVAKATPAGSDDKPKAPTVVISIDQGEELFLTDGQDEAQALLTLLRDLSKEDAPGIIVLFTIRSDTYERLQQANPVAEIRKFPFDLGPMPKGSYADVIKGPARRLSGTARQLKIEDALVDALLADIDQGNAKDALPLLAFTLERLYLEYGGDGRLTLSDYVALGRIKGSIEAAVARALTEADKDSTVPKDLNERLALLRRGLIPWLAGIDPETSNPRRRVARKSEIPEGARPLIEHLIEQRLLATDVSSEGEQIIEPVHEALLRQWGLLQGWLVEDAGLLVLLERAKRAAHDWATNGKDTSWLTHTTSRLESVERLAIERPDLAEILEPVDREYLAACRRHEDTVNNEARAAYKRKRRMELAFAAVLLVISLTGIGYAIWMNLDYLKVRSEMLADDFLPSWPKRLTADVERDYAKRTLQPGETIAFHECTRCPTMIVVPAGKLPKGRSAEEKERQKAAEPSRDITIASNFAVGKFEVTFQEWKACIDARGCQRSPDDQGWGGSNRPVINVSWDDAQQYVTWLSARTGKTYRLLTEAEWEYAARAGSETAFSWGDDIGTGNASCWGCGGEWDGQKINRTAPVGTFAANAFGLYDMHGNVGEWVQDCANNNGAPMNAAGKNENNCDVRVVRGGSWNSIPDYLRSVSRTGVAADIRNTTRGFRVARTLVAR